MEKIIKMIFDSDFTITELLEALHKADAPAIEEAKSFLEKNDYFVQHLDDYYNF